MRLTTRTGILCAVALLAVVTGPLEAQQAVDPLAGQPTAPAQPEGSEPEEDSGPFPCADLTEPNRLVKGQDWEEADLNLATQQEQCPDDVRLLLMRGEVLLAMGRGEDAEPFLSRVIELDPERPRAHFQLATLLHRSGDAEAALEAYGAEIRVNEDPNVKVMAHLNRSVLYQQIRKWVEAAEELDAVVQLEPQRVEVFGDMAALYLQAGRLEDCEASLARGAEAGFSSAAHYYSLGTRYYKKKDYQKSIEFFNKTLDISPDHADTQRNLAAALEQVGRTDEAVDHLKRYLELKPDAPDAAKITKKLEESGKT